MAEPKYVCRSCGHRHTEADWLATPEPRYCHACGSMAVKAPPPPPEPKPEPVYDSNAVVTPEPVPEPEPEPAPPDPEPEPEPEPDTVKVPDDIQVDELGAVKKTPRKKAAAKVVPKAPPKPKRRRH